eukprot:3941961-Rhodomonas_salina.3
MTASPAWTSLARGSQVGKMPVCLPFFTAYATFFPIEAATFDALRHTPAPRIRTLLFPATLYVTVLNVPHAVNRGKTARDSYGPGYPGMGDLARSENPRLGLRSLHSPPLQRAHE